MSKAKLALAAGLNLLLICLSVLTVNIFLSYKNYTLYTNGKWENGKSSLARGVVGTSIMMLSKAALSQNYLNISDWAGYQELINKDGIAFHTIRFKCAAYHHPFAFILSKTDSLTFGICFNYRSDSNCFFIANREGKFLHKEKFSGTNSLHSHGWDEVEVQRNKDSFLLKINNSIKAEAYMPLPSVLHIGFRGSKEGVYVDDIIAADNQNRVVMSEDFSPPLSFHWLSAWVMLVLLGSFFFLFKPQHTVYTIYINAVICLGIAGSYYIYFNHLSGKYPRVDDYFHWIDIDWHGVKSTFEFKQDIDKRLKREYPVEKIAGIKPVILFVGSSQTWGAGVSDVTKTMPARIEKNLRNYFSDSSITVINCGVPGSNSDSLFYFYQHEWGRYLPLATVINLSNNDHDSAVFRKYIRSFIEFNNSRKIKTLLIAEPNDINNDQLQANHNIMNEEGLKGKVHVAELQSYMDSCYETGFIWWDFVHCTDYGYQLLSDKITPEIIDLIKRDSLSHH